MEAYLARFLKPPRHPINHHDLGPLVLREAAHSARRLELTASSIPFTLYEVDAFSPTVLYIHTFNSHRIEVLPILRHLLREGFNIASIQLQRIEVSSNQEAVISPQEGLITFGRFEFEQIKPVLEALQQRFQNKRVVLWGRSMGAVCAILSQAKYGHAAHLVLDSPFHNIEQLMATKLNELASCSSFIAKKGVSLAMGKVSSFLKFDASDFHVEKEIANVKCPVTFIYNPLDLISNKSTPLLYSHCKGPREIFYIQAAHQQNREEETVIAVCESLAARLATKRVPFLRKLSALTGIRYESPTKLRLRDVNMRQSMVSPQGNSRRFIKLRGLESSCLDTEMAYNRSTRHSTMLSELDGRT